jgi:hypothetical protein
MSIKLRQRKSSSHESETAFHSNTPIELEDQPPYFEARLTAEEVSGGLLDETNLNDLQSLNDKLMQAEDDFQKNRTLRFRAGSMVIQN